MSLHKSLAGKRIGVTRAAGQSGELTALLREHGAIVENLPCIQVEAVDGIAGVVRDVVVKGKFDWIFFTSANAVFEMRKLLNQLHLTFPDKARIAAIGSKTAHAAQHAGFGVDFEAAPGTAENFIAQIFAAGIKPAQVLYPTSKLADNRLEKQLDQNGVAVTRLDIYQTVSTVDGHALRRFFSRRPDAVVFYSPSAVRFFFEALPQVFRRDLLNMKFAAIGATTALALQNNGVLRPLIANQATTKSLVNALVQYVATSEHLGSGVME